MDSKVFQRLVESGHKPVPLRDSYVPAWYTPHADTSLSVIGPQGEIPGFKIADVLEERRWAIDAGGRCLPQEAFERLYKQFAEGFGARCEYDPVPHVLRFVSMTAVSNGDHQEFREIGFDPLKPATKTIEPIWAHNGETFEEYQRRSKPADKEARDAMVAREAQAKLIVEMADSGLISPEAAAKRLGALHGLGSESEDDAAPEAQAAPAPTKEKPAKRVHPNSMEHTAPCGATYKGALHYHTRKCDSPACAPQEAA